MVIGMAGRIVERIPPAQEAKQIHKNLIQPLCAKHRTVTKLMRSHTQKETSHRSHGRKTPPQIRASSVATRRDMSKHPYPQIMRSAPRPETIPANRSVSKAREVWRGQYDIYTTRPEDFFAHQQVLVVRVHIFLFKSTTTNSIIDNVKRRLHLTPRTSWGNLSDRAALAAQTPAACPIATAFPVTR